MTGKQLSTKYQIQSKQLEEVVGYFAAFIKAHFDVDQYALKIFG